MRQGLKRSRFFAWYHIGLSLHMWGPANEAIEDTVQVQGERIMKTKEKKEKNFTSQNNFRLAVD